MGDMAAAAVRRRLQPHPSSVGEARRLVRSVLADADREDLQECAELVVSEVVTNALVHAGTPLEVTARAHGDGLYVEVVDGSPHLPSLRSYTAMAGTGRGLRLLEQLVDRWGVRPGDDSKAVWFELSTADPPEQEPRHMSVTAASAGAAAPPRDVPVEVELLNVPLLLHAAWQQHAESLLREHLLARLDEDDATDLIERHAAANDAMSLLRERVPSPDLDEDPEAVMAGATEPMVTLGRVTVPVPQPSVPNFRVLDEMLSAAAELADTGVFLTAATQPEIRLLRRWICTQVSEQTDGTGPTPWVSETGPLQAPARPAVDWDPAPVNRSDRALVAADDTNQILAVSDPAVELLGYDGADQLVGHRLVEIIPSRFHQAHLAGFTLHLAVGRSPLLGKPVVVPALHRDGTETPVQLTVESHHLTAGRRLFLAELVRA